MSTQHAVPALTAAAPSSPFAEYSAGHDLPLGGYATLVTTFGALIGTALLTTSSRSLHVKPADTLLLGVATFQLTRIVARDRVLAPLRSPFTTYQESAGAGEVEEKARGTGLRKAIGELVTCPYCLAPWAASALSVALVRAPNKTRWLASILAIVALSDVCQQGYVALKQLSK